MKTIDKAREIAEGNAEIEKAAMQMAKWICQSAFDKMHEKQQSIRTEDGWDVFVSWEDINDILNDLNGTHRIYGGSDEHTLKASIFDKAMKAVGNAQFGHLK